MAVLERLGYANGYRAITPAHTATNPAQPYGDGYYDRRAVASVDALRNSVQLDEQGRLIEHFDPNYDPNYPNSGGRAPVHMPLSIYYNPAPTGHAFGALQKANRPVTMLRRVQGTVRVFRQKYTLEDAIGSHACSLEANMRVTNVIPLGCPLPLTVTTVNDVATLKGRSHQR
jgi:hypothetical protein